MYYSISSLADIQLVIVLMDHFQ